MSPLLLVDRTYRRHSFDKNWWVRLPTSFSHIWPWQTVSWGLFPNNHQDFHPKKLQGWYSSSSSLSLPHQRRRRFDLVPVQIQVHVDFDGTLPIGKKENTLAPTFPLGFRAVQIHFLFHCTANSNATAPFRLFNQWKFIGQHGYTVANFCFWWRL